MRKPVLPTCPGCGEGTIFSASRDGELRPVPCDDDCSVRMIIDWWKRRGFKVTVKKEKYSGSFVTSGGYISRYTGTGLRLRKVVASNGQIFRF